MPNDPLITCPACHRSNFTPSGFKHHKCNGSPDLSPTLDLPTSEPSSNEELAEVEIVKKAKPIQEKPAFVLNRVKVSLESLRGNLVQKEEDFLTRSLPDRVKMGLHCLIAHELFCHNPGKGGRPNKPSTRDGILSQGFEGWISDQCPWLKKPTAYRYMTALKGLGLDETSTEEAIDEAIAQHLRVGPVTLKALCDAAVTPLAAPPEPPQIPQQSEFEFLRDTLAAYREHSEEVLSVMSQLKQSPGMLRAACARAYAMLSALTGTQWSPSDVPDELASVNPDSISL